jgi:hypothetical protein
MSVFIIDVNNPMYAETKPDLGHEENKKQYLNSSCAVRIILLDNNGVKCTMWLNAEARKRNTSPLLANADIYGSVMVKITNQRQETVDLDLMDIDFINRLIKFYFPDEE